MIIEETLEFKPKNLPFKVEEVENFIKSKGIDPIRWSIGSVKNDIFIISVSGIKKLK